MPNIAEHEARMERFTPFKEELFESITTSLPGQDPLFFYDSKESGEHIMDFDEAVTVSGVHFEGMLGSEIGHKTLTGVFRRSHEAEVAFRGNENYEAVRERGRARAIAKLAEIATSE